MIKIYSLIYYLTFFSMGSFAKWMDFKYPIKAKYFENLNKQTKKKLVTLSSDFIVDIKYLVLILFLRFEYTYTKLIVP